MKALLSSLFAVVCVSGCVANEPTGSEGVTADDQLERTVAVAPNVTDDSVIDEVTATGDKDVSVGSGREPDLSGGADVLQILQIPGGSYTRTCWNISWNEGIRQLCATCLTGQNGGTHRSCLSNACNQVNNCHGFLSCGTC